MSSFSGYDESKHARGKDGKFAAKSTSESDLELASSSHVHDLNDSVADALRRTDVAEFDVDDGFARRASVDRSGKVTIEADIDVPDHHHEIVDAYLRSFDAAVDEGDSRSERLLTFTTQFDGLDDSTFDDALSAINRDSGYESLRYTVRQNQHGSEMASFASRWGVDLTSSEMHDSVSPNMQAISDDVRSLGHYPDVPAPSLGATEFMSDDIQNNIDTAKANGMTDGQEHDGDYMTYAVDNGYVAINWYPDFDEDEDDVIEDERLNEALAGAEGTYAPSRDEALNLAQNPVSSRSVVMANPTGSKVVDADGVVHPKDCYFAYNDSFLDDRDEVRVFSDEKTKKFYGVS